MEFFLQQLYNGAVIGLTYGVIAMGLTMIFGLMKVLNVAHGEFYMLGALLAYYGTRVWDLGFFLSLVVAIVGVGIIGYLVEKILVRKLYKEQIATTAIVTLGLSMIIANVAFMVLGPMPKSIPSPFAVRVMTLGPIFTTPMRLFLAVVAVVFIIFTTMVIKKTKLGIAMRATFEDNDMTAMVGVSVGKIRTYTFVYGCILAGISGVLLGTMFVVEPFMGDVIMLKSWVVVIVGGLGNIPGSIAAGMLLGITESLTAGFISSAYKDAVGFLIVILVLVFRPYGIFSRKKA